MSPPPFEVSRDGVEKHAVAITGTTGTTRTLPGRMQGQQGQPPHHAMKRRMSPARLAARSTDRLE